MKIKIKTYTIEELDRLIRERGREDRQVIKYAMKLEKQEKRLDR